VHCWAHSTYRLCCNGEWHVWNVFAVNVNKQKYLCARAHVCVCARTCALVCSCACVRDWVVTTERLHPFLRWRVGLFWLAWYWQAITLSSFLRLIWYHD
jgi:hypothetical protein